MKKKITVHTLSAMLLALCGPVLAQQPTKIPRIGYLTTLPTTLDSNRRQEIRRALQELGYVEGQNISTVYRSAEGDTARLPGLAAELVKLKVDVIVVAGGFGPISAAADATKTIPIIMTGAGLDPVEAGLVESLARPGGNITGFTNIAGHLGGKRLELLKESGAESCADRRPFPSQEPAQHVRVQGSAPGLGARVGYNSLAV
jgi:putative tryptophan/tyrosine transport system substrate-binding protein